MIVPGRVLGLDGGVAASERIALAGLGIGGRGGYVLGVDDGRTGDPIRRDCRPAEGSPRGCPAVRDWNRNTAQALSASPGRATRGGADAGQRRHAQVLASVDDVLMAVPRRHRSGVGRTHNRGVEESGDAGRASWATARRFVAPCRATVAVTPHLRWPSDGPPQGWAPFLRRLATAVRPSPAGRHSVHEGEDRRLHRWLLLARMPRALHRSPRQRLVLEHQDPEQRKS